MPPNSFEDQDLPGDGRPLQIYWIRFGALLQWHHLMDPRGSCPLGSPQSDLYVEFTITHNLWTGDRSMNGKWSINMFIVLITILYFLMKILTTDVYQFGYTLVVTSAGVKLTLSVLSDGLMTKGRGGVVVLPGNCVSSN